MSLRDHRSRAGQVLGGVRAARISELRQDRMAVLEVELRVRVELVSGQFSAGSEVAPPQAGLNIHAVLLEGMR